MFISLAGIKFWLIVALAVGLTFIVSPSVAQTPSSGTNTPVSTPGNNTITNLFPSLSGLSDLAIMPTTEWIELDGRNLFQVTALENYLPERVQKIESNLKQICNTYFNSTNNDLKVKVTTINGSPTININGQYLLTVTDLDAQLRGIDTFTWADQLSQILQQALLEAKQERQSTYLIRQGKISCGIFGLVAMVNWILLKLRQRIKPTATNNVERVNTTTDNISVAQSLESPASNQPYKASLKAIENLSTGQKLKNQ